MFVPLAVWLAAQPEFQLDEVWWLSVSTVWLQATVSYLLMRQQFKRRLVDEPRPAASAVVCAGRELAQRAAPLAVRLGRRSRYHLMVVEEQLRRQSCAHDYSLV